jgi:hypothetical protein
LLHPKSKEFKERKVQVEWLLQVARSPKSKGTGLAASRMHAFLTEISQDDSKINNLSKNSLCDVTWVKRVLNDLSVHINELDQLRDKLIAVLDLSTKLGGEKTAPRLIDVYTGHVADNIVQKLMKDGAVLFPVDFHITAPEYPDGGGGHRSVVYLEKIAGSFSCNLHYFETDGPTGGKYSLASVRRLTGSSSGSWTAKTISPDAFKSRQDEQLKPGEPSLRFSEFRISNISIEKIDPNFIRQLLAKFSYVYPNATTQADLNKSISRERKVILDSIFSHLATLGKLEIPNQIMQYSQQGSECEQVSLISFLSFYIGRNDVCLAKEVADLIGEHGINLGLALMNKIRVNIDQLKSNMVVEKENMKDKTISNLQNELDLVEGAVRALKKDLKILATDGSQ